MGFSVIAILLVFLVGIILGAVGVFIFLKKGLEGQAKLQTQLLTEEIHRLIQENQTLKAEVKKSVELVLQNEKLIVQTQSENQHLIEKLNTQKSEFINLQNQFTEKFENLANKIFEEKTKKISEQNVNHLKNLIDPVKDQLKHFEKRIEDTYSTERMERGTLKGEINKLIELNVKMNTETTNLTKALKGDNKTQGYWGELILENILTRSGLRKDEEYFLQGGGLALRDSEQNLLKPDVLIRLPDNKFIVVDSKVSLTSFEAYVNNESSDTFAKDHIDSLKRHIDSLASKKYHYLEDLNSPELTLLFMPVEPALTLALKMQPDILLYAWDKQIALVSPTTLFATLRTVSTLWTQDKQTKNTLEIAKSGGLLYEKFAGLLTDLNELGQRLDQAHDAYNETLNKLSNGKGSLIRQVERLRTLGAKTEKNILDNKIKSRLPSLNDIDVDDNEIEDTNQIN